MTVVPVLDAPVRWWACPSCDTVEQAQVAVGQARMHPCPALGGLAIPLVAVAGPDDKPRARQVAVQSESGYETAAVLTERMDGSNDCTVFPSPARAVLP